MTLTPTAARRASQALTDALNQIASQGLRTHCSQPETHHYWTSEHEAERAMAAMWCAGCPVITPCLKAAIANDERACVWGGRDFSQRPGRAKRLEQAGSDDDLFSVA